MLECVELRPEGRISEANVAAYIDARHFPGEATLRRNWSAHRRRGLLDNKGGVTRQRRLRGLSSNLPGRGVGAAYRSHNAFRVCDPSDHHSALRLALAQAISLTTPVRPQRAPSVPTQHGAPASPASQKAGIKAGTESGCSSEHPMKSKG